MILQILGTILSIAVLSLVFVMGGSELLSVIFQGRRFSKTFRLTFGYFFGGATFLALWRVLLFLSHNARISFWVAFVVAIVWIAMRFGKERIIAAVSAVSIKKVLLFGVLWAVLVVFVVGLWTMGIPSGNEAFENFGSAHSAKYGNVAHYIFTENNLPILNQNYGQSLLTVAPAFVGFSHFFLTLNLWLSTSIFFLFFVVYSLFQYFGLSRRWSLLGMFLVMFGNTALSFTHVLSLDSNSPFAMSSYSDATFSVATSILFVLLVMHIVRSKDFRFKNMLLPAFVFGVYWHFAEAQNIVILLGAIGLFTLYYWYTKAEPAKRLLTFAIVFFVASVIGSVGGGMLTPKFLRDPNIIPGTVFVISKDKYTGIKPELPYAIGWAYDWSYGTPYDPTEKQLYVSILQGGEGLRSGKVINGVLWRFESNAWAAIRVMFFPLVGIVGYYFIRRRYLQNVPEKQYELSEFWKWSAVVYVIGFIPTFFVIVSGRKGELSRFMIEPYAVGMLFASICLFYWIQKIESKFWFKTVLIVTCAIITIGPVTNALGIIHKNFPNMQTIREKMPVFLEKYPGYIGADIWSEWKFTADPDAGK